MAEEAVVDQVAADAGGTADAGADSGLAPNASDMDILNDESADDAAAGDGTGDGTGADDQKDDAQGDDQQDDAAKSDADKTDEEKAAEAADKKAKEEADAAATATPADNAVKALKERLNKSPELKAALDKDPALRNSLFAQARLATEAQEFKKEFTTLELARQAKMDSEDLSEIEQHYEAKTPDGFESLINRMWEAGLTRDPKTGEAMKDANGMPINNGAWAGFFHHYRIQHMWPNVLRQFGDNEEIMGAARAVAKALGEEEAFPDAEAADAGAAAKDDSRLTPQEKQWLEKGKNADEQAQTATQKANEQFTNSIRTAIKTSSIEFLSTAAKKAAPALSEHLQKKLAGDAFSEISKIAKDDRLYQRQLQNIMAQKDEKAPERARVAALAYIRERYADVVRRLAKEYGAPAVQSNADTRQRRDAQKGQTEVKGGGGVAAPTHQDEAAMVKEGNKLARTLYSRDLTDNEILSIEDLLPKLQHKARQLTGSN